MLNGRKRWPGNAVWCDIIVVYARDTADNQVKAFVVEKDNPGYAATKIGGKMSLRMVQNADITLTNCRVSEEARLQNCNSFKDVAKVLAGTRNFVAWAATGNAVAAYDIALNYAQRRKQFGKPIAKTQMIQSMLVEMLGDLTAMQLYCIRMGRLIDEGKMKRRWPRSPSTTARSRPATCAGWPATSWAATESRSTSTSCATCATWKPWSPTKEPPRSSPLSSAGTSPGRAPSDCGSPCASHRISAQQRESPAAELRVPRPAQPPHGGGTGLALGCFALVRLCGVARVGHDAADY